MFKDPILALGDKGWTPKVVPCTVATDADGQEDDVYVTLNIEGPAVRLGPVSWRPRTDDLGAVVLPSRGMDGVLIVVREAKPWLLY